jgi:hypothetical protein
MNSDFNDLLSIFNDKNVEYMVVGGYAVMVYAEPRPATSATAAVSLFIKGVPT